MALPVGNFASYFDSQVLCVTVTSPTPSSTTGTSQNYFLHRRLLIAKSAYFATLLTSPLEGIEVTSSTVHLSDTSIGAFDALVDYLYHSTYTCAPKERYPRRGDQCVLHAEVYVLAERMCMNELKAVAVEKMQAELKEAYPSTWDNQSDKRLEAKTVLRLLEIVYPGTLDRRISADGVPDLQNGETVGGKRIVPDATTDATVGVGQVAGSVEGHVVCSALLDTRGTLDIHPPFEVEPAERPRDDMRTLIVKYAASIMSRMKLHPAFTTYLRDDTEFLEDLITFIPDGSRL